MIEIKKDRIIFPRNIWEELKKNSMYSELIEDIEDRIELERAIEEQKKSKSKFVNFDKYDKVRMNKVRGLKSLRHNEDSGRN